VTGAEIEIITEKVHLRLYKSEVESLLADNKNAQELVGWRPQYSGLESFRRGLQETVNWFRSSVNMTSYKLDHYNL
tara:strand:- start:175 stop:402 length:228 start_codon:yes stop_codon:yes gene_type:complete